MINVNIVIPVIFVLYLVNNKAVGKPNQSNVHTKESVIHPTYDIFG